MNNEIRGPEPRSILVLDVSSLLRVCRMIRIRSVLHRLELRRLDFSGSKNSAKPNEMICAEKQRTVYKLSLLTTLNYVRDSDKVSCRSYCVLKIKNICELGEGNIFQLSVGY